MTGSRNMRAKRNRIGMSIEQTLAPILIFNALFGVKGMLKALMMSSEEKKEEANKLIENSSILVTNAIYVYLLMFTKIFG